MDQAGRIKLLSGVDVLEPLAAEEIAWLSERTPERSFASGEMVYAEGDASDVLFFSLAGRIRLYGMSAGQEFTFEVIQCWYDIRGIITGRACSA